MRNNKKFPNYEKAVEAFENQLLNISKALHTWKILAFICLGIEHYLEIYICQQEVH